MQKTITIILAVVATALTAEISSSYALLEKNAAFQPELKTEPIPAHAVFKKESTLEQEKHPVYRAEDRARIEPVRPGMTSQMKHDMLADEPAPATDMNRVDNQANPTYGFLTRPVDVAYPDVPYAPGYGYDSGYSASNYYDMYGNSANNYLMEPDTSAFGMLWSQVPDARTLVSYAGRTISWVFSSVFSILLGVFLTIEVCTYTNLCSINLHGFVPNEMRSLMSPERLEKISHAADFVKNAIDKYQKIQQVTEPNVNRNRRAIFY